MSGLLAALSIGCSSNLDPAAPCGGVGDDGAVATREGVVRGHPAGSVCSFLGVRYAAAPVADMRFRVPGSAPLHDPENADHFGSACSQIDLAGNVGGDEDCLFLNVWTSAKGSTLRPVLVFLHGGGNVFGSSQEPVYDGAVLAEKGELVVVTVDYRLGALGYLAHPALSSETSPLSSGNYGLLDQIAALTWVKANVARFGGDPARVTVFGQSAGGRTVCALLGSPAARGLFQRAWIQSGTCEYPLRTSQEQFGLALAQRLGCTDDPTACLRAASREAFLLTAPGYPTLLEGSPYNPNIDGAWLPEQPLDAWRGPDAPDVPVVVASDADEVAEVVGGVPDDGYPAAVEAIFGNLTASILPLYPLSQFASARQALVRMITDARYTCPLDRTARALALRAQGATYRAIFARQWPAAPDGEPAAFHGLELRFLFRTFASVGSPPGAADEELADELMARVGAFARDGVPNVRNRTRWSVFDSMTQEYMNLDTPSTLRTGPARPTCVFWDSL
jgi:para-nitrobenzyl esterase